MPAHQVPISQFDAADRLVDAIAALERQGEKVVTVVATGNVWVVVTSGRATRESRVKP